MNHDTTPKRLSMKGRIARTVSLCLLSLSLLPAGVSAQELYTTDGVHVRSQPDADSAICLTAQMGTPVTVTGQKGNWTAVCVNGINGYIYKDYLSDQLLSPEEASEVHSDSTNGSSTTDSVSHTDASSGSVIVSGTSSAETAGQSDYINSTEVNLRAEANSHCVVLTVLTQGETVQILGQEGNWTRIARSDGSQGYVYTIYLGDNKPADTSGATDSSDSAENVSLSREDAIDAFRSDAISYAEGRLGDTYSQSLRDTDGYADCSSLVRDAYENAAGVFIGNATSSQADMMNRYFYDIGSVTDAVPGDLLYHLSDERHTGIYLGDGQVLHASQNAGIVKISTYDSGGSYWEYGCNAAAYCYESQ